MQKVYVVDLSPKEQIELLGLLGENEVGARKIKLAHILLSANEGYTDEQIAIALNINQNTVEQVCRQYVENGLEHALEESPRSGDKQLSLP